jgi:Trk-type K+ transport system membrane component
MTFLFTLPPSVSKRPFVQHAVHLLRIVIVFAASIGGCGFPVVAKKVKWMNIPPKVFFFCKHFGTGVLIATAFVHVRIVVRG